VKKKKVFEKAGRIKKVKNNVSEREVEMGFMKILTMILYVYRVI
jgi:hypothetical protein